MPARRNRVRPDGELVATPDRGLFWGNRGPLLNRDGELARHHRGTGWIVCELVFRGRHRVQWQPGRLTELYFLDEATALAAGHRPCGECRHAAYRAFAGAWAVAHPDDATGARHLDARLHADRLAEAGRRRVHEAPLPQLPDGTMVGLDGTAWLVLDGELLAWSTAGYTSRRPRPARGVVPVLTPRATVATLAGGYRPVLHPTAGRH